jgi:hypothetical protein
MQPPIRVPNPADPDFTADNDAKKFDPFDPVALDWNAAADSANQEAALEQFRLGITYTATRATTLFAPTEGEVSWIATFDGTQLISRTLVLTLLSPAIKKLHLAGRGEDEPEPVALARSALPWNSLPDSQLQARLLFTFADGALEERLRTQITALYSNGTGVLKRRCGEGIDLQFVDGVLTPSELPAGPNDQRHLPPWWDGKSAAPWRLTGTDDQNKLVDLEPNESVLLQAQIREGFPQTATDHWYLCNVGFLLRSLGVAGDPAYMDNDDAYQIVSGDCLARIMSGGTLASGGTNPDGETPLGFEDVIVVHGGSQPAVLLQPPADRIVPGSVFSFTSAEDIEIFSPRLEDQFVGLRLWQPTYDSLELGSVRDQVRAARGAGADVFVPPQNSPILATEYGDPGHATGYPDNPNTVFFPLMEWMYGYDGRRAKPPEGQPLHPLAAMSIWNRTFNLNELQAVRPEHPKWRIKGDKETFATVRRLFPLRVELRLGNAVDAPVLCTLSQDEIDCIRQEYVFHMKFTDYFQDYAVMPWGAAFRAAAVFPAPNHRIGTVGANLPIPALGTDRVIPVPARPTVRPVTQSLTRYRYTLLMANWHDRVDEVAGLAERYASRIRALLSNAATLQAIRNAMTASPPIDWQDPTAPAPGALPPYAAEIVATVSQLLSASFPPESAASFLQAQLTEQDTLARFAALNLYTLQLGSAWRPPEYNESVSKTPLSNHQRSEAFDAQPRGSGGGRHNPLAQLCLHLVGQDLYCEGRACGDLARPRRLSEMLLENNAQEYLSSVVAVAKRRNVVVANFGVGGSATFRLRPAQGPEEEMPTYTDASGEAPSPSTFYSNLATEFLEAFRKHRSTGGNVWPAPLPTYLELYIFALCVSSHVHFTWIRQPGE